MSRSVFAEETIPIEGKNQTCGAEAGLGVLEAARMHKRRQRTEFWRRPNTRREERVVLMEVLLEPVVMEHHRGKQVRYHLTKT